VKDTLKGAKRGDVVPFADFVIVKVQKFQVNKLLEDRGAGETCDLVV
jgi:hypothetical protein